MNYSISDIAEKLADRAEEVCALLLPQGKRDGDQWLAGDVSGSPGVSCRVSLDGQFRGHWRDWADDSQRGDLIDLWQAARGTNRIETLRQTKDFLGIHENIERFAPKIYQAPKDDAKIKRIAANGKAMHYLTVDRKLEPSVVNRYQIYGDGESVVFPYFTLEGKLVNRSYVKLARTPDGKKIMRQEKGGAPSLWGWHGLNDAAINARKILICEGQIDCMTWAQWGVAALSVPNGTNAAWIEYDWGKLEMFSEIFLSFDMDEAGQSNLQKVIQRLGLHRCRIVKLPHKDANDCLLAGLTAEDAESWLEKSEYPRCEGLLAAREFRDETIAEFYPDPTKPQGFSHPILQRYDGGINLLPGDVSIWTGVTSYGKTTFLNFLTISAVLSGRKSMMVSLEMKPGRLIARMFRGMASRSDLTREEIDACFVDIEGALFFADKIGYIEQKELLEMMLFAFSRYGVEFYVIDSLMRIAGLEEDYPAQGDFLNRLQEFAKKTNSHINLVAHPRKTQDGAAPGRMDVKGSSLIVNNCDNLIAVHKNLGKEKIRRDRQLTDEEDHEMWDAEIVSEKQRDKGWHGRVLLRFSPVTFSYSKFP